MKIEKISQVVVVAIVAVCVLLATGCGKQDDAPTAGTTPVRGEPIQTAEVRGEPIQTAKAKAEAEAGAVKTPEMAEAEPPALAPAAESAASLAETAESAAAANKVENAAVTAEAVNAAATKLKKELSATAEEAEATLTAKANDAAQVVKDGAVAGAKQGAITIEASKATVTLNAGETLVVGAEAARAIAEVPKPGRVIVASTPTVSSRTAVTDGAAETAVAEAGSPETPAAKKPGELRTGPNIVKDLVGGLKSDKQTQPTVGAAAELKPVAAAAPTPAVYAEPEVVKSGGQDYLTISFDRLASFEYEMPDEFAEVSDADAGDGEGQTAEDAKTEATKVEEKPKEKDQIPATVRKFNNRRIALEGFMLPLKVEDSLVTEMLIMRDQSMCCFGSVPKINEWVSIRMTGKGVKPVMDEPVTIYGKLKVGEIRENGYLVGIYEMDGERMGSRIDL